MIKMTADTMTRVLRVYKRCLELDVEQPGFNMAEKFEKAMAYVSNYADQEGKGLSNIIFTPEYTDPRDGEMRPKHFNFWCSLRRGETAEESFGMLMHFHNGGAPEFGEPVELSPESGPHWGFHS